MPPIPSTTPTADTNDVHLLQTARDLVTPALRGWIDQLSPSMRPPAGYHFGWLDLDGRPVHAPVGKAIRPALAFTCATAVGGTPRDAMGAAVAVELLHGFTLIHDDIIDNDATRRHQPSLWAAFGISSALLVGDVLLNLAHQVLAETGRPHAARSVSLLAEVTSELIEGQAMDIAFERRTDVIPAEYAAMATAKTGALMGGACALGALDTGCADPRTQYLVRFGRQLGLAFQITDDLLGAFGDPATTGKPVGSDLAARKKSYPVLAALRSGTHAGRKLAELYASEEPLDDDAVRRAVALVESAGGRQRAEQAAGRALERAHSHLDEADLSPDAVRELTALARLMTRHAA